MQVGLRTNFRENNPAAVPSQNFRGEAIACHAGGPSIRIENQHSNMIFLPKRWGPELFEASRVPLSRCYVRFSSQWCFLVLGPRFLGFLKATIPKKRTKLSLSDWEA